MEFGRRAAVERELEKTEAFRNINPSIYLISNYYILSISFNFLIFFLYYITRTWLNSIDNDSFSMAGMI